MRHLQTYRTITLSLLLILFLTPISAQKEFREGFIITLKKDTIRGFVANNNYATNSKKCDFKHTPESSIITYSPNDIHSYKYSNNGKYYIAKTITYDKKSEKVFLEYLIKGKLNFYFLRKDNMDLYFAQLEDGELCFLDARDIYYEYDSEKGRWVVSESKTVQKVKKSTQYKGTLNLLLAETPNLQKEINSIALNKKSLTKLAKEYHHTVCDSEQCILFEKKGKAWKRLGFTAGVSYLEYTNQYYRIKQTFKLNHNAYLGIQFSNQLLSLNENTAIKIELYLNKIDDQIIQDYIGGELTAIGTTLPISLQYHFPSKKIRPYVSAGVTFHKLLNTRFEHFIFMDNEISKRISYSEELKKYNTIKIGANVGGGLTYNYKNYIFDISADYMLYFNAGDIKSMRLGAGIGYQF